MEKVFYKDKKYLFRIYENSIDMYGNWFDYIIKRPEFSASISYIVKHLSKKDTRIVLLARNRENAPRTKKELKRQRNFIYCPRCQNELISGRQYSSEHLHGYKFDRTLEYFKCNDCKTITEWDFNTPTPILVNEIIPEQN